jgi:pyruvate ferredoxin oxidoreductase gamma subunit
MYEIRWHARAGQGAVTAAKALADAAFAEGKYIQAFPDYGPERMGAPVKAYNRIDEEPIRTRGIVEHPKVIIIVDPSLVGVEVSEGATEDAVFLVNSTKSPEEAKKVLGVKGRVFTVDATRIAQETIGLRKPNTPMLGAVAKVTGVIQIDTLLTETEKSFGNKYKRTIVERNLAAIRRAFEEVKG